MVWGDKKIAELIELGMIKNTYKDAINPASINIRLGTSFASPRLSREPIELGSDIFYDYWNAEIGQKLLIEPGEFMLATTMEWFDIPTDCAVFVQGRSSIGRIGLSVQNAGFTDPGFRGHLTLELKNESRSPIGLIAGYPVAQLVYMDASDVSKGYHGKYLDQKDATGSRMNLDDPKTFGLKGRVWS